jgi:hypothetical protein
LEHVAGEYRRVQQSHQPHQPHQPHQLQQRCQPQHMAMAPPSWSLVAASAAGVCAACWYALASSREAQLQLAQQLAEERAAHSATELKRKQERAGRSKAEREKRSALKDSDAAGTGVECESTSPAAPCRPQRYQQLQRVVGRFGEAV